MANDLYSFGSGKREVVKHTHTRETVIVFPVCEACGRQTRTVPCEWCQGSGTVSIVRKDLPESKRIPEGKRLK